MRIVGILLAAGRGSRFGGDKLRARLEDGTAIGVQAARNLKAALPESIAVVRPEDGELSRMLAATGIEVTPCPDAAVGMGASLSHAVRARADADGWIVALADMPLIRPQTILRIAAALGSGARIAAPAFRGQRGHPVGFAAGLGKRLAALTGDAGARDIVRDEARQVVLVEVDDPGVLADIDTPAELERVTARSGN
ncbi:MAG: nucleotidyltransferase family protein [Betaproteobacteria bacterium]|nr:MAG: nucleotidyltransferase family protein [Betaproteobacteria bacterium]